jgi:hypothetical protein
MNEELARLYYLWKEAEALHDTVLNLHTPNNASELFRVYRRVKRRMQRRHTTLLQELRKMMYSTDIFRLNIDDRVMDRRGHVYLIQHVTLNHAFISTIPSFDMKIDRIGTINPEPHNPDSLIIWKIRNGRTNRYVQRLA